MIEARRFRDRVEAGRLLAGELDRYVLRADVVVLGLPRGGVPVAYEVARALRAPLDVMVVRKLGLPQQPELAMGAIASGGVRVLNTDLLAYLHVSEDTIQSVAEREQRALEARERAYRGMRPPTDLAGRTVVLVDDGLATGASMRAAVSAARQRGASRIVVAVPVAAPETIDEMRREVDEIVYVQAPSRFSAVGLWYEDFAETSDDTVRDLLQRAADVS
ncbi:MAG: phosphoribosyltransferase [Acidobacteria bacterium]|nr:phosphoribosyltransferase [Acidobacteriota bacterium]